GVDAVGDERLRAVDDVVVAVADCGRAHAGQVAAHGRLGHGDGGDELALHHAGEPAGLLLVGGALEQIGEADVVVQGDPQAAAGRPGALDLLGDDEVEAEVVDARTAVLLGHGHAEEARGAGGEEQLTGHLALPLPRLVVGGDLLLDERPEAGPEQLVLLVEQRAAHASDRSGGGGTGPMPAARSPVYDAAGRSGSAAVPWLAAFGGRRRSLRVGAGTWTQPAGSPSCSAGATGPRPPSPPTPGGRRSWSRPTRASTTPGPSAAGSTSSWATS